MKRKMKGNLSRKQQVRALLEQLGNGPQRMTQLRDTIPDAQPRRIGEALKSIGWVDAAAGLWSLTAEGEYQLARARETTNRVARQHESM